MPPFVHRTPLRVRYQETDQMGVAHHSAYLVYFEMGRTDMLRCRGLSYAEMERRGTLLAVVNVAVQYLAPARYDEEIEVLTQLGEVGWVRVRFDYEIVRKEDPTRKVCAGHTLLASVDRELRPRRLPKADYAVLSALGRNAAD